MVPRPPARARRARRYSACGCASPRRSPCATWATWTSCASGSGPAAGPASPWPTPSASPPTPGCSSPPPWRWAPPARPRCSTSTSPPPSTPDDFGARIGARLPPGCRVGRGAGGAPAGPAAAALLRWAEYEVRAVRGAAASRPPARCPAFGPPRRRRKRCPGAPRRSACPPPQPPPPLPARTRSGSGCSPSWPPPASPASAGGKARRSHTTCAPSSSRSAFLGSTKGSPSAIEGIDRRPAGGPPAHAPDGDAPGPGPPGGGGRGPRAARLRACTACAWAWRHPRQPLRRPAEAALGRSTPGLTGAALTATAGAGCGAPPAGSPPRGAARGGRAGPAPAAPAPPGAVADGDGAARAARCRLLPTARAGLQPSRLRALSRPLVRRRAGATGQGEARARQRLRVVQPAEGRQGPPQQVTRRLLAPAAACSPPSSSRRRARSRSAVGHAGAPSPASARPCAPPPCLATALPVEQLQGPAPGPLRPPGRPRRRSSSPSTHASCPSSSPAVPPPAWPGAARPAPPGVGAPCRAATSLAAPARGPPPRRSPLQHRLRRQTERRRPQPLAPGPSLAPLPPPPAPALRLRRVAQPERRPGVAQGPAPPASRAGPVLLRKSAARGTPTRPAR